MDKQIRRIAIVGTGVIGASWAAEFLAKGFDVVATDPAPNAEANLRKYIDGAWPALLASPTGFEPVGHAQAHWHKFDEKVYGVDHQRLDACLC